jgi:hypothetical protein
MAKKLIYNPLSGEFDYVAAGGGGTGNVSIPQYDNDPVSPADEEAWVRHAGPLAAGSPIGLLLALTNANAVPDRYYLSYKTIGGPIKRTEIT